MTRADDAAAAHHSCVSTHDQSRESARRGNGQFGQQNRGEAKVRLRPSNRPTGTTPEQRQPSFDPDAPVKRVKVAQIGETEPTPVTLRPCKISAYGESWEVFADDGSYLGTVTRYTGSIDRRIPHGGRHLRAPGKDRTLWSYQGPEVDRRALTKQTSQATCLRALLDYRRG